MYLESVLVFSTFSLSLVTLFKKAKRDQPELSFSLFFDKCSNVSYIDSLKFFHFKEGKLGLSNALILINSLNGVYHVCSTHSEKSSVTLGSIQLNISFQILLSPIEEVILGVLFLQNRFWYHNFLDILKSFKLRFKMTGIVKFWEPGLSL